jgi:hypothetical protein
MWAPRDKSNPFFVKKRAKSKTYRGVPGDSTESRSPLTANRERQMQAGRAILNVRHLTTYRYKRPVEFGDHRMMLRPRDGHDQRLLSSELIIEPEPRRLRWLYDTFDNCVAVASFSGAWTSLRVENRFSVERIEDDQPGGEIDPRAQFFPFSYAADELPDIARAMERLYSDPAGDLDRWVRQFVSSGATVLTSHLLMTLTYAIKEGFSYERREAAGVQTPIQTLERARSPRRRSDPCLVSDLPARRWLGRVRSDQRAGRQQGSHPRRGRAQSIAGRAPDRRLFRRFRR